jgi:hypothetical protein
MIGIDDYSMFDAVHYRSPFNLSQYYDIMVAKSAGCKIWLDYDDDLINEGTFAPLSDLKGFSNFCLPDILKLADIVTVTTFNLLDQYQKHAPDVPMMVIPNAWNDYILPFNPKRNLSGDVFTRGNYTKEFDFYAHQAAITNITSKNPDRTFKFLGYQPAFCTGFPNAVRLPETNQVYEYLTSKPNCSFSFYPLSDNITNHSKSNIFWLESTYFGASALVPEFYEGLGTGYSKYDFEEKFNEMVETGGDWQDSVDMINEKLLLSKVNSLRQEVVDMLLVECAR